MKNNKKQYTLEEFEWVWKDSSVYDILNQFYYEHIELQKLLQQTDQLTNNWNELEELLKIKKARMLNEPDYSKYYLEGYETAIQTTHSSHSGIMLETAKKSIVVLCDELLDKMKEIKEGK